MFFGARLVRSDKDYLSKDFKHCQRIIPEMQKHYRRSLRKNITYEKGLWTDLDVKIVNELRENEEGE